MTLADSLARLDEMLAEVLAMTAAIARDPQSRTRMGERDDE